MTLEEIPPDNFYFVLCVAHSAECRPSLLEGRRPIWKGVCYFWSWRDEWGSSKGCSHCWVCGDHCRGESNSFVVFLSSCADLEVSFSWSDVFLKQPCQAKLKKRYCLPSSVCLSIAEHFSLLLHPLSVCPLGCAVKIWTVTSYSCFTNNAEQFC